MTTEACTTKLAYLFGRTSDSQLVSTLLTTNLRGEISPPETLGREYFENDAFGSSYVTDLSKLL